MSAVGNSFKNGVNGFLVSDGSPDEMPTLFLRSVSELRTASEQLAENGFEMSK